MLSPSDFHTANPQLFLRSGAVYTMAPSYQHRLAHVFERECEILGVHQNIDIRGVKSRWSFKKRVKKIIFMFCSFQKNATSYCDNFFLYFEVSKVFSSQLNLKTKQKKPSNHICFLIVNSYII